MCDRAHGPAAPIGHHPVLRGVTVAVVVVVVPVPGGDNVTKRSTAVILPHNPPWRGLDDGGIDTLPIVVPFWMLVKVSFLCNDQPTCVAPLYAFGCVVVGWSH